MAITVTVRNAAELTTAFKGAVSATTILLAPGDYGDVLLRTSNNLGLVTIKSLNTASEARFETLKMIGVNKVQIENVEIAHTLMEGERLFVPAVSVLGSSNVTFIGIDLHGSLNGTTFDDGNGMTIIASKNINILDSTFTELNVGLSINNSSGIVVAGNTGTMMRSFMVGVAVKNALFELNYLHDLMPNYAAGDHPDFFQIATGGTADPSTNLTFRSNVMIESPGDYIGGFYIQSERFQEGVRHSNVTVENNYFLGNYRHAVSFTGASNIVVKNNTILNTDGTAPTAAISLKDVHGAKLIGNVEPLIVESRLYKNTNVAITNNVDLWDPQFKIGVPVAGIVDLPANGPLDFETLGVKAGSLAARLGAGFDPVPGIGDLAGTNATNAAHYKNVLVQLAKVGSTFGMFGDTSDDVDLSVLGTAQLQPGGVQAMVFDDRMGADTPIMTIGLDLGSMDALHATAFTHVA